MISIRVRITSNRKIGAKIYKKMIFHTMRIGK